MDHQSEKKATFRAENRLEGFDVLLEADGIPEGRSKLHFKRIENMGL